MMRNDLTQKILFAPLQDEADELYILAAYATPNICVKSGNVLWKRKFPLAATARI